MTYTKRLFRFSWLCWSSKFMASMLLPNSPGVSKPVQSVGIDINMSHFIEDVTGPGSAVEPKGPRDVATRDPNELGVLRL